MYSALYGLGLSKNASAIGALTMYFSENAVQMALRFGIKYLYTYPWKFIRGILMQAIKMKVWEVNAFRMLFIFEFVFLLIVGGCWFFITKRFFDIPTYVFGPLTLFCVIGQLLLLAGKDYVAFSEKEIFVFFAKKEYRFSWEDIVNPKFYSSDYRIFLCQNTIDFSIRDKNKFVPFSEKFGGKQISCTPEQYKQFYALYVSKCDATE